MSGSLGTWPISPAAKPAKPAPSLTRSSRLAAGTSFALGRPYRSTNCAKKNSIAALLRQLPDLLEPRIVRNDHRASSSSAADVVPAVGFSSSVCQTSRRILRADEGASALNTLTAEPGQIERVAALTGLVDDTPEIVIDLDAVRANIVRAAALAAAAGVALRPHTKTHKLPQIARLQLEAGAVGVQVAKLGEAEVMVAAGIDDILVGYPIVGEQKLARLADLAERATISVTVDSDEVARGISRAARERGLTIPVLLELDTGMHRLGVLPGKSAVELAERIAIARRPRAGGCVHPRGPRVHAGTRRRREGAHDRRGLPGGGRDGRGDPGPRPRRPDRVGGLGRHVPVRDPLPRGDRGQAGHLRLQRPQPARAGRGRAGRPRRLRRHDRGQPPGARTASSSTPGRRS